MQTLALHPSSKIAKENLDVFCEAWESQLCDMALLLREINDVFEGKRGASAASRLEGGVVCEQIQRFFLSFHQAHLK